MQFLNRHRALLITLLLIAFLLSLGAPNMSLAAGVSILLSGLTLAALYFLVAGGLSLIFGLMDVLNFAHGSLFMLGAYAGWTFYSDPRLVFNTLPLFLAFAAGALFNARVSLPRLGQWLAGIVGLAFAVLAVRDFPLAKLIAFGATVSGQTIPTFLAEEPFGGMLLRVGFALLAGTALSFVLTRARKKFALRAFVNMIILLVLALVTLIARDGGEQLVVGLDNNLRFGIALIVGGATGALLGALMEWSLIRPLYSRPIYQILLTLGLVFVADQGVRSIWGPSGFVMDIPSFFNTPGPNCPSDNLFAWFTAHCDSIMILGRAFPSYRLFIISIGTLIAVGVVVVLRRSRLGMIIRAGVQDSQMVEALGINVRRVFTLVFALGAGIAGLGGVVAAPFLGVSPALALEFLLQAFIVVVIGGMGSVPGAAVGALLVGFARAYGDHLVLAGIQLPGMTNLISGSPAIAQASTVLIMAIVLLIRPTGIFGKKE